MGILLNYSVILLNYTFLIILDLSTSIYQPANLTTPDRAHAACPTAHLPTCPPAQLPTCPPAHPPTRLPTHLVHTYLPRRLSISLDTPASALQVMGTAASALAEGDATRTLPALEAEAPAREGGESGGGKLRPVRMDVSLTRCRRV